MSSAEYAKQFADRVQPIPAVAQAYQAALGENDLEVVVGLTEDLAEQLVKASKEPHVAKFCPNDPGKRFGSVDKIRVWQEKGRLALPLVHHAGNGALELAGFGWMGPGEPGEEEMTLPGAKTTFAMRLYERALGKGNATPYAGALLAAHEAMYGNEGVWLETWADNKKAVATYEHVGFKSQGLLWTPESQRQAYRRYMTLGDIKPQGAELISSPERD